MLYPILLLAFLFQAGAVAPPPQVLIQPSAQEVRPVRIASAAFGQRLEIEVRDLPGEAAKAAIQAALDEVSATERLLRIDSTEAAGGIAGIGGGDIGGIGSLNTAAGRGPQPVDPKLMPLLVRAQEFCFWSEGAHGPLGRSLYEAWGLRAPKWGADVDAASGPPTPTIPPEPRSLDEATAAANCERLTLSVAKGTGELAAGSRLDLGGFAEGHAVDRAVEVLRKKGVANGFVQLGPVLRAFGKGVDGRGWNVVLPRFTGMDRPAGRYVLRDRASAVLSTLDGSMRIADQILLPYVNQRTGLPAPGVIGVVTVTELAVDAQALAIAMALTGPREGQFRMGSLRPSPSVLWYLGNGSGPPLQVDHHWGDVIAASR